MTNTAFPHYSSTSHTLYFKAPQIAEYGFLALQDLYFFKLNISRFLSKYDTVISSGIYTMFYLLIDIGKRHEN